MWHELRKNFMPEVKIAVEKPRFPLTFPSTFPFPFPLTLSSSV